MPVRYVQLGFRLSESDSQSFNVIFIQLLDQQPGLILIPKEQGHSLFYK